MDGSRDDAKPYLFSLAFRRLAPLSGLNAFPY